MILNIKEAVEKTNKDPKIIFREMVIYLTDVIGHKMTTIASLIGMNYDKVKNIKKGGSSADLEHLVKLIVAFPELERKIGLAEEVKGCLPEVKEDVDELKSEVKRLKRQNEEIILTLIKMQNKLFHPPSD
jgi:hypothetical protein